MAPKKKGNKKNDDWESELGESATPVAAATPDEVKNEAEADPEEEFGGGGLMAAMKKNRSKKKQKGRAEDFLEGEDPSGTAGEAETAVAADFAVKAPEEATMEDEFAIPEKSKKGKAAAAAKPADQDEPAGDDDEERGADGKVMSKKEKEKAKKEREKQRKKEQVRTLSILQQVYSLTWVHRLQRRRRQRLLLKFPKPRKPSLKTRKLRQPFLKSRVVRKRNYLLH
jgi:translation initiation factor 5B